MSKSRNFKPLLDFLKTLSTTPSNWNKVNLDENGVIICEWNQKHEHSKSNSHDPFSIIKIKFFESTFTQNTHKTPYSIPNQGIIRVTFSQAEKESPSSKKVDFFIFPHEIQQFKQCLQEAGIELRSWRILRFTDDGKLPAEKYL